MRAAFVGITRARMLDVVMHEPRDPGVDVDAYWQSKLERSLPRAATLVPEVHTLDEAIAGAKLEAIRTYRTQVAGLMALNPRLADPATLRYEALWQP